MKTPALVAHEQDCWRCLSGRRCDVAAVLLQDGAVLFDLPDDVNDPLTSDLPAQALRRWRRGEVIRP